MKQEPVKTSRLWRWGFASVIVGLVFIALTTWVASHDKGSEARRAETVATLARDSASAGADATTSEAQADAYRSGGPMAGSTAP